MRSCIKTGCRWPAVATLSYRYATAEVWLADLSDPHPATHDLCPHHADDLRVPRGWTLVDDRRPAQAVHEPSAAELVERNTRLRSNVDAILERPDRVQPQATRSRYADLLDNLPTYDPATDADVDVAGDAEEPPPVPTPTLVSVGIAHELAPIGRDAGPDPDAVHETGIRGAIVVQLPLRTDYDREL